MPASLLQKAKRILVALIEAFAVQHGVSIALNRESRDKQVSAAYMPDVFPHETAVAWARAYMKKHPLPRGGLDDMDDALRGLLADAAKHINQNYDVVGLHSSFPDRLRDLVARKGDRLTQH